MAVFQYGAFITRISGSIGGTNFRLFRNMPVISNKSQGGSYQVRAQNKQLSKIAWLFREFGTLPNDAKIAWQTLSDDYTFPDKFGVYRIISGRQFYTKMNCQLLPVKQYRRAADMFIGTLAAADLISFVCDFTTSSALVTIETDVTENYFLFQLEFSTRKLNAPQFTRRLIFDQAQNDANFSSNLYAEIVSKFPSLKIGDFVRLYVIQMSDGGLRQNLGYIDTTVI